MNRLQVINREEFCPECGDEITRCPGCGERGHGRLEAPCVCGCDSYDHSTCYGYCMTEGCQCMGYAAAFTCSLAALEAQKKRLHEQSH